MPPSPVQRPTLHLTAGPLSGEDRLFRDLEDAVGKHPSGELGTLLIVVPSRSLRDHLQASLVRRAGRAVLGVRITTLFGLALELAEDATGHLLAGADLFPLFARRLARGERDLRRVLHHLSDGYSALLGAVRDLLDAGLEPALAGALVEALAEEGKGAASLREVRRAQAIVRVAAGTLDELEKRSAGRRSTLLSTAATRLRAGGSIRLPQAAWIYGFADATGVATDLIEALLDRAGGRLYLDRPPDPADPEVPDAGVVFTRRFRERIEGLTGPGKEEETVVRPSYDLFRALGSDGEVREAAIRIRTLLDSGAVPERVSLVARRLPPYERAIRTQFAALAIPFSTFGTQSAKSAAGRRADALADLLENGTASPIERWLEACRRGFGGRPDFDLRSAFATLGLGRVREVAALIDDEYLLDNDLALDARLGFATAEGDAEAAPRLVRRRVPAAAIRAAVEAADALAGHFDDWESDGPVAVHQRRLASLLDDHLGDPCDSPLTMAALRAWEVLADRDRLTFEEFAEGVAARLRDFGRTPFGGAGGGVQVLDVIEARGRTAEHLFVVGLNRGQFPRVVREDPLLPDSLRGVLSRQGFGVLPDLVDKRSGFDEERFLFAQLLASSPSVTLSWQDTDDDQAPLAPSPLLERLRWTSEDPVRRSPPLARPVVATPSAVARTPMENALAVALHGRRGRLVDAFDLAFVEGDAALAEARVAVLDELDPTWENERGRAARRSLGPYFGAVGQASEDDPRDSLRLYVTTLERLAGCPWQAFLERLLRLAPVPDPLAALPGITPRLIGAVTHAVLEAVVRRAVPRDVRDLQTARGRLPRPVPWPEERELDSLLARSASRVCRRQGIAVDGFATVLARAVGAYLERARQLDWEQPVHTLGAEIDGSLVTEDFSGAERTIHFRADRLDLGPEGLVATDYKTGARPVSAATTPKSRRDRLVGDVARGERLQAAAYALSGGAAADVGRYLFLHPALGEDRGVRDVRVESGDREITDAFRRAAAAAMATWDSGTFFPRLVEPDEDREPFRCSLCEVRDACLRSDSGARRRLRRWMDRHSTAAAAGGELSTEELVLLTTWRLGAKEGT